MSSQDQWPLIITALPLLTGLMAMLYRWLAAFIEKRMPANVRAEVVELAKIAVHAVEQQTDAHTTSNQKKAEAMQSLKEALQTLKSPMIPSDDVLSSVIESIVFALNEGRPKTGTRLVQTPPPSQFKNP